ncbi:1-deoxy-D-xylulose 5-phosphate reductoisomerase [Fibrobacter succinogenes subsp. succinogenes S85]|jgi:1-deoxy-D-xylulose-5-phosphate reductoisomerase|uniref:1-deoxy-D-xylulose 5-phosphate reductoisomerase n=1 Tax=Fibrobacter succinogenes (strain ATCC 19169 / S85) TaxID=59374 RepID=C9RSB3_FIBSS|nr:MULTISPECIES: 1-deoxy-D-xylulose-5-phosphate reductoisomerase [Fibrobacter]ACX75449.1 1-deoxy-D-xylulose 5-phosphate reductoisomerase [Fibrobacter succinogenes subsp. succinogenes S85]ADL26931.1 1-deoxy-D-xylulose 5-phosphate reductoisomerase [Fibrobacter succinogenes subsp. succinogenes S85]SHM76110.1 1-deoxy-D-xylulose 5-phosphate reductoisomerase [Fibrobacter sp. UWB7]SMG30956.1 1-deoxy-D-xylulose 5-phosphate reductoisomerase [Fibrobacter sp. UWB13]
MKNVVLLGATGSIGTSSVDVIQQHSDLFHLYAVAANSSVNKVAEIVRKYNVERVCMFNEVAAKELEIVLGRKVLVGMEGLCELAADPKADIIINALMGAVGCLPTITAIEHGKHVALANKETMVMAGPVIWDKLAENPKSFITPIDSEHSAIFQCLEGGKRESEVEFLEITASGGPFREWPIEKFEKITVADALNHPVWSMGKKITIDSASMMNKGLEVLEAHFLFHIPYDQIKVVVHPQSMVHSLVQFRDGSLMAQLGAPDMRIPIQVALTWPDRLKLETKRLDLPTLAKLTFFEPDFNKFRCLALAFEAGRRGGIVPSMMNAANEVLVDRFLKGNLKFTDIPKYVEMVMEKAPNVTGHLSLEQVLEADKEARLMTEGFLK